MAEVPRLNLKCYAKCKRLYGGQPLTIEGAATLAGMCTEEFVEFQKSREARERERNALTAIMSDHTFSYGLCMQMALRSRKEGQDKAGEDGDVPAEPIKQEVAETASLLDGLDNDPDEIDEGVSKGSQEYEEIDFAELGIDPSEPTQAKPGTEEKILTLAARVAAGLPLWHPGDCNHHGPGASVARLNRK